MNPSSQTGNTDQHVDQVQRDEEDGARRGRLPLEEECERQGVGEETQDNYSCCQVAGYADVV